jgi:putative phage-type endonuclease
MKIVPLVQRSLAWQHWRQQGLGSSDAAVIWWGRHFEKDIRALWREKVGLTEAHRGASNPAMRRGQELEPELLHWYRHITGLTDCQPLCAEHDEYSWLRGSCDAWSAAATLVAEFKYARQDIHAAALQGQIHVQYQPQIWHLALVTQAREVHLVTTNPRFEPGNQYALVSWQPDPAILQQLFVVEQEFWRYVQTCTPPPDDWRQPEKAPRRRKCSAPEARQAKK